MNVNLQEILFRQLKQKQLANRSEILVKETQESRELNCKYFLSMQHFRVKFRDIKSMGVFRC